MPALPGSHRQTAVNIVIGSMILPLCGIDPVFVRLILPGIGAGDIFSIPLVRFCTIRIILSICILYYTVGHKERQRMLSYGFCNEIQWFGQSLPMPDEYCDKIHLFHTGFFQYPGTCLNGTSSGIDVVYQDYGADIWRNVSCRKCLLQVFQTA